MPRHREFELDERDRSRSAVDRTLAGEDGDAAAADRADMRDMIDAARTDSQPDR